MKEVEGPVGTDTTGEIYMGCSGLTWGDEGKGLVGAEHLPGAAEFSESISTHWSRYYGPR